ncbi:MULTISPECIES: hypothetical protein [Vibrio]|uniref:hypothetical protein n=1 Tax=Vibrio TaxID=662 RepID=UPI001EFE13A0|nr:MULTISPECIES: hypothetical protein [Vibrio]EKO3833530.1 hypothetical protein [Vibrio harveyi]ELV8722344.1 hypothetical protein [Vibrio harveyi]MCG9611884.1 hypothetical protein [Vibrio harveyi]MCG9670086.1 hypothetical protein [Vibrio harveyi]MCQ9085497.1 hypothetical protein [Vibrio harveyi]
MINRYQANRFYKVRAMADLVLETETKVFEYNGFVYFKAQSPLYERVLFVVRRVNGDA